MRKRTLRKLLEECPKCSGVGGYINGYGIFIPCRDCCGGYTQYSIGMILERIGVV
jgi:hypothetical protein